MATSAASTGSSDDAVGTALDQLIAEYLAAEEAGLDVPLDDWLGRAGGYRGEFEAFVRDHSALRRMTQDDPIASLAAGWATGPSASWPHLSPLGNDSTAPSVRPSPRIGSAADLRRNPAGVDFGDYRLVDEVARGGMGVVYRAEHRKLNRVVALKMILSGEFAGPEDVERFQKEATAAAQLDHPGIVPVFEVGEQEGRHYFTMPLVEGPSLATRIAEGPLTGRQAAAVALKIAEALAYAHSKGIVHRDLKPANVLLARVEGLNVGGGAGSYLGLIGGEPKVTDFGLAKRVSSERGLTVTGQVVGTPSYMSPEQAAGKSLEVGPASDIYSIGAILYEMLTGRPPFRAATPLDTMVQVLESEPIPPRSVNSSVDRDLQTICLKCLAKSARLRYSNASALADDLRRFLEGEPIEARDQNLLSRVTYAIARRRHVEEFSGWGRAITMIGVLVFAAHVVIFTLESWGLPQLYAYWLPRLTMFALIAANIAWHRPTTLLPTNAAERLIWTIWIGFHLGLLAENASILISGESRQVTYSVSALLGGVCFFVMGVHVWGGWLFDWRLVLRLGAVARRAPPLWSAGLWPLVVHRLHVAWRALLAGPKLGPFRLTHRTNACGEHVLRPPGYLHVITRNTPSRFAI